MIRIGEFLLEEPMLNRGQRYWPGDQPLHRVNHLRRTRGSSQFSDRLMLKDVFGRQPQTRSTCLGDDLDTEDRIAAQLEEVVVHADSLQTQNSRPDFGQHLLYRRTSENEFLSRIEMCLVWLW